MEDGKYKKWNTRVMSGIFIVLIGSVLLLDRIGVFFPFWLFKWPVLIIIIGLFMGLRHGFREPGWIIIIIIGGIFLLDIIEPAYSLRRYSFPLIVITVGLFIILRPMSNKRLGAFQKGKCMSDLQRKEQPGQLSVADQTNQQRNTFKQDYIDSVAIFGESAR